MSVLLGIIGSLFGVVVGAFLTRWIDSGYERRREIRQAVTSALILREEIRDLEAGLKVLIEDNDARATAFLFSGLDAWEHHRNFLLPAGITHHDWVLLAHHFRHFLEVVPLIKAAGESSRAEGDVSFLEGVVARCKTGRDLLEPFIVETPVPFFRPTRIFDA